MYTQLIIVEGMDNTGKSTLIEEYKNVINGLNPNIKIEVIHMEKPPKELMGMDIEGEPINYYKLNEFQHNTYMELPNKLREIRNRKNSPDILILDRAWLSEYVYGHLYRKRSKKDIIIDNIIIEKKIMNIFGANNVHLIYLYPENLKFIKHYEDGKSLVVLKSKEVWPTDKDAQKRFIDKQLYEELLMFNEAFNELSILENKIPIQVNKSGSDNIFKNNTIVEIFKSLDFSLFISN